MKKARLSLFGFTLALPFLITACGSGPQRSARGGDDAVIGPRGPSGGPKDARTMVCAPGSFQGGNECIPVKVAGCPAGQIQQGAECVCPVGKVAQGAECVCPAWKVAQGTECVCPAGTVLRGEACVTPEPVKKEEARTIPPSKLDLEFGELIDSRPQWLSPRAKPLLITEIQGLEVLFASIPKDSPDRPKLLARLALGYVELEAAVMKTPQTGKEEYLKQEKIAMLSRRKAIQDYQVLVDQYPKHCATVPPDKSTGCIDEILYFLSLEQIRDGNAERARASLLRLIKDWPKSDKLGQAYFLLGEVLRLAAPADPKNWEPAEKAFAKAAGIKGPMKEAAKARVALVKKERGENTTQVASP